MTTLGAHGSESGAGPLLEDRYRLEVEPSPSRSAPVLAHAFDEESDQWVTLLVLPDSSSMLERLALRSQVRRLAEVDHPQVPRVLDVVDTETSLAVVLPFAPGAQLLSDVGVLPVDGPAQLRSALQAVHAIGRAHGGLDEGAVLVLPDATVGLLPVPPDPAATPAEDLRALGRLAARYGHGTEHDIPSQREAGPLPGTTGRPLPERPAYAGATRLPPTAAWPRRRPWEAGALRAAVVAAGALGGALLADLLSRLVT
jgi:hypothetical protein